MRHLQVTYGTNIVLVKSIVVVQDIHRIHCLKPYKQLMVYGFAIAISNGQISVLSLPNLELKHCRDKKTAIAPITYFISKDTNRQRNDHEYIFVTVWSPNLIAKPIFETLICLSTARSVDFYSYYFNSFIRLVLYKSYTAVCYMNFVLVT